MKISISILFLLAGMLSGCKKDPVHYYPLVGTRWILETFQNTGTNQTVDYPAEVKQLWGSETILLTDSANTFKLNVLCNTGIGKYSLSANSDSISLYEIATTKIYCQYAKWGEYFINNLDSAWKYEIIGNKLKIYSKGTYNLNLAAE
jgi:hypothetical protein